jgi:hypothetical protein
MRLGEYIEAFLGSSPLPPRLSKQCAVRSCPTCRLTAAKLGTDGGKTRRSRPQVVAHLYQRIIASPSHTALF